MPPEQDETQAPGAAARPQRTDPVAAGSGAAAEAEEAAHLVEEDLDELAAARRERDEYLELAQRTRADFENYRKRVAGETSEAQARGKSQLARELIPAIDNLERALRAAGVDPDSSASPGTDGAAERPGEEVSAKDALAHGVGLVHRELREALRRAGVESYDPAGEAFDPSLHEAVSTATGGKPGVVVETLDRGYRVDSQVLRPARVIVGE